MVVLPARAPTGRAEAGAGWTANEIDHFIARKFAEQKLTPAGPAAKRALIRRVTLDLTGLPPTPEQVTAFLKDPRRMPMANWSTAFWPAHATANGKHPSGSISCAMRIPTATARIISGLEAWRYRDYVINSFNTDKPYDRFVREQLAGDEIDPGNRDALIATMFMRHWIYEHNQRDVEFQWAEVLADVTNVTADAFLGLGMQCARCHDHKFDPILQKDYYRMQAFLRRYCRARPCPWARWRSARRFSKRTKNGGATPKHCGGNCTPLSIRCCSSTPHARDSRSSLIRLR